MTSERPLAGRRIVVTRPAEQAGPLVELLQAPGATAVVVPLTTIVDDPSGMRELAEVDVSSFDWVIVTSRNAALRLVALHDGQLRNGSERPKLAAVGRVSAAALPRCDLVPEVQSATGLLDALPLPQPGGRALVVNAVGAEPVLVAGLRTRAWEVTAIAPYCSAPAALGVAEQLAALSADAVLFASGSAARSWCDVFGTSTPPVVIAIGPQTATAAQATGLTVTATASDHSLEGLVAAALGALAER